MVALNEARALFQGRRIGVIASIGCGKASPAGAAEGAAEGSAMAYMMHLLARAVSAEETHRDLLRMLHATESSDAAPELAGVSYYRINPPTGDYALDERDPARLQAMNDACAHYLGEHAEAIESLVAKLGGKAAVRPVGGVPGACPPPAPSLELERRRAAAAMLGAALPSRRLSQRLSQRLSHRLSLSHQRSSEEHARRAACACVPWLRAGASASVESRRARMRRRHASVADACAPAAHARRLLASAFSRARPAALVLALGASAATRLGELGAVHALGAPSLLDASPAAHAALYCAQLGCAGGCLWASAAASMWLISTASGSPAERRLELHFGATPRAELCVLCAGLLNIATARLQLLRLTGPAPGSAGAGWRAGHRAARALSTEVWLLDWAVALGTYCFAWHELAPHALHYGGTVLVTVPTRCAAGTQCRRPRAPPRDLELGAAARPTMRLGRGAALAAALAELLAGPLAQLQLLYWAYALLALPAQVLGARLARCAGRSCLGAPVGTALAAIDVGLVGARACGFGLLAALSGTASVSALGVAEALADALVAGSASVLIACQLGARPAAAEQDGDVAFASRLGALLLRAGVATAAEVGTRRMAMLAVREPELQKHFSGDYVRRVRPGATRPGLDLTSHPNKPQLGAARRRCARVLALEGLGAHALSAIVALELLEERTRTPVGRLFELVVGSGVGALVALVISATPVEPDPLAPGAHSLALTRARSSVERLVERLLPDLGASRTRLLRTGYRGSLEAVAGFARQVVADAGLSALGRRAPGAPHAACVLTRVGGAGVSADAFLQLAVRRTYALEPERAARLPPEVEAGVGAELVLGACVAIPGDFPPEPSASGAVYMTGAMAAPCPALVALTEAAALWPERRAALVVSVGAGTGTQVGSSSQSIKVLAGTLLSLALSGEREYRKVERLLPSVVPGARLWRLDAPVTVSPAETSRERLGAMEESTRAALLAQLTASSGGPAPDDEQMEPEVSGLGVSGDALLLDDIAASLVRRRSPSIS